jgi:hypothetical protein
MYAGYTVPHFCCWRVIGINIQTLHRPYQLHLSHMYIHLPDKNLLLAPYSRISSNLLTCQEFSVVFFIIHFKINTVLWRYRTVYPKVSQLVAWSENCIWYRSLPLDAVVSLFCESVKWVLPPYPFVLLLNECFVAVVYFVIDSARKLLDTPSYSSVKR